MNCVLCDQPFENTWHTCPSNFNTQTIYATAILRLQDRVIALEQRANKVDDHFETLASYKE